MNNLGSGSKPSNVQLMHVIEAQTEIVRLGLNLNDVMNFVVERVQHLTGAMGAVVELAEGDDMVYRAVSGMAKGTLGLRLSRANSLSGLSVKLGQTLYCEDSETDDRVDRIACRRVGLRSMAAVPLIHLEQPVGVLKVFSEKVKAFSEADIEILILMSDLIAAAMYNAARFGIDELFRQATRDNLTGLANRALFLDSLRQGIARGARAGEKLGILILDMDGLKPINDHYGHRTGDAALTEIAQRIKAETRADDTVARLGGDEFAVVLAAIGSRELALQTVQRIANRCNNPFEFETNTLPVGVSIGLAVYPEDGIEPDQLIDQADQSMYQMKREKKKFFATHS